MSDLVTVAQKLYEKFVMLSHNTDALTVVMVKSPQPCVVVAIEDDEGRLTPIARLLTKNELDDMVPDFERSEKLALMYREALAAETRRHPSDFGDGSVHPFFTEEFLEKVGL